MTLGEELDVLHLNMNWAGVCSELRFWNKMQLMPFQSLALMVWASSAMLGEVCKESSQSEGLTQQNNPNRMQSDEYGVFVFIRFLRHVFIWWGTYVKKIGILGIS